MRESANLTKKSEFLQQGFSVESIVSTKGQTVIPKEVREALGITEGTKLFWYVEGDRATIRPLPEDAIAASMGALKHLKLGTAELLAERRADTEKEEAQVEESRRRWQATS